jgi:hypothetical protein
MVLHRGKALASRELSGPARGPRPFFLSDRSSPATLANEGITAPAARQTPPARQSPRCSLPFHRCGFISLRYR